MFQVYFILFLNFKIIQNVHCMTVYYNSADYSVQGFPSTYYWIPFNYFWI